MSDLFSFDYNDAPNEDSILKRMQELAQKLDYHSQLYYQDAAPEILDSEFDALLNELKKLESEHPNLAAPDSPTQRVGGAPLDGFEQRQHLVPMLSIEDVHELKEEELTALHEQTKDSSITKSNNLSHWFDRFHRSLGHSDVALTVEPKMTSRRILRRSRASHSAFQSQHQTSSRCVEKSSCQTMPSLSSMNNV